MISRRAPARARDTSKHKISTSSKHRPREQLGVQTRDRARCGLRRNKGRKEKLTCEGGADQSEHDQNGAKTTRVIIAVVGESERMTRKIR